MRNNPKTFTLVYDEIEIGDMIGRGCSSVVLKGVHGPTGTKLALKVPKSLFFLHKNILQSPATGHKHV